MPLQNSTAEGSFGLHRMRYHAPALIEFDVRGAISDEDARGITGFIVEHTRMFPDVLFLVDVAGLDAVSLGARKLAAASAQQVAYRVMAFHGATFQARLLVTLTVGAMRLLSGTRTEVRFFKTAVEARKWLGERHCALYPATTGAA